MRYTNPRLLYFTYFTGHDIAFCAESAVKLQPTFATIRYGVKAYLYINHHHHVLYVMLAERSKTICSNSKIVKIKKKKNVQIKILKNIDASINAMELTRVSVSLKEHSLNKIIVKWLVLFGSSK